MRELILGGARSGKSRLAEQRAADSGLAVTYVATAVAGDDEMAERIRQHREQRPQHWHTVEAPTGLGREVSRAHHPDQLVLVDCLTLWLGQWIDDAAGWQRERDDLLAQLEAVTGHVILVSNEVGLGIVPDNALARHYRDEAGRLHQQLAAACDRVTFVAAGLPLTLKQAPGADDPSADDPGADDNGSARHNGVQT